MYSAKSLEKLLSIASSPLGPSIPEMPQSLAEEGERGQELYRMLVSLNGFFVFESALHVFPLGPGSDVDLETWNSTSLWRSEYGDMVENLFFFAEDAFGNQFAIRNDSMVSFDSETGVAAEFSLTLEGWAECILGDYDVLTGYPLAHQWQVTHGSIPRGYRLAPRIPFVLGGEYALHNLYLAESVELMRSRASLAQQIRDLPEGAQVKFIVT